MPAPKDVVEHFREVVVRAFGFLSGLGFRRDVSLEFTGPVGATVVYLGKHLGFILSLDIRDQAVGAEVVKVVEGKVSRNLDGGFSSDLFSYLVKYAGYRGGVTAKQRASGDYIETMVQGWVDMLTGPGRVLLSDWPTTLPKR